MVNDVIVLNILIYYKIQLLTWAYRGLVNNPLSPLEQTKVTRGTKPLRVPDNNYVRTDIKL